MQLISYTNDNGDSIKLYDNPRALFSTLEGQDVMKLTDTTSTGYRQDGTTLNYSVFDEREMTLTFIIKGRTHEEFLKARDLANKAFRPRCEGYLYYNDGLHDVYIRCHPTSTVKADKTGYMTMTTATVELIANDPLFYDRQNSMTELASWEGGFNLKTSMDHITKFKLRHRGAAVKNIYNDGHVEVPFELQYKGPAEKPALINVKTAEYIRINQTLNSNQTLIVNTNYNDKTVEIETNGVKVNAYNYLDLGSTFFYLGVGDNMLHYTNDNTQQVNQVNVIYRRAYGGI